MFFRNITILKRVIALDRIMPKVVNAGFYDASIVHKNVKETKNRKVHMYEIEFVLSNGGVSHISENSYPIRKNAIICAKPGQIRHTELPFKCLYIHFLAEDKELINLLNLIPDFHIPGRPKIYKNVFSRLISSYTSADLDFGTAVMANLFGLISILVNDTRFITNQSHSIINNADIINKALKYINENYCHSITLDDIAAHVHLSRIYFHNLFVSATGQTTRNYIQEKRLSKAKQMIITTNKSFAEIALECGFSSQAYLNYSFKKILNCTPGQYKKNSTISYQTKHNLD